MGPSTMLSILPLMLTFTQSLIVGTALAASKSSGATLASKNCLDSSRKLVSKGNPARYQIALAMRTSTVRSSARSMSLSDRYEPLISAAGCAPKPIVERISSNVCPAAPFMVMPSAIEALSGDMKMFESARVRSSSRSRLNPNALLAPMTACSPVVSARGSAVIRRVPPDGPVGSLHAATTATIASRPPRRMSPRSRVSPPNSLSRGVVTPIAAWKRCKWGQTPYVAFHCHGNGTPRMESDPIWRFLLRRGLGHRSHRALECRERRPDAAARRPQAGHRVVVARALDDEALYRRVARRPRPRTPQRPDLTGLAVCHGVRTGRKHPVVLRRAAHPSVGHVQPR